MGIGFSTPSSYFREISQRDLQIWEFEETTAYQPHSLTEAVCWLFLASHITSYILLPGLSHKRSQRLQDCFLTQDPDRNAVLHDDKRLSSGWSKALGDLMQRRVECNG
jgi:hypothetical protein